MSEFGLLPMWPIWLALAVIAAAGIIYCAIYTGSASHRPTRMIGITYCEDCSVTCDEAYLCFCCRESRGASRERTKFGYGMHDPS